jgi:hypothetical protein
LVMGAYIGIIVESSRLLAGPVRIIVEDDLTIR